MTGQQRDNLLFVGIISTCLLLLIWVVPTYTPEYPGYGVPGSLVPNVAISTILILALIALGSNVYSTHRAKQESRKRPEDKTTVDRIHLANLLLFMVPSFLLMPIIKRLNFLPYDLGFILTGIVFMAISQWLCGQRKPVQLLLVAIIPVGVIYAAMRYGLGVPMP